MIYFFAGDNQFAIKAALTKLTEDFVKKHGELALERIDAEEASASVILDATQSLPFLSPCKFVVIQNAGDKELLEKLAEIETPESITVAVLIPKLDKRAGYYKKLAKLPQFKLFDQTNAQNVPGWVAEYVKEQGGTIASGDARYLVERVGANQILLSNEIDKLITYRTQITKDSINELTDPLPQSTVFQLLLRFYDPVTGDVLIDGRDARAYPLTALRDRMAIVPQEVLLFGGSIRENIAFVDAAGGRPRPGDLDGRHDGRHLLGPRGRETAPFAPGGDCRLRRRRVAQSGTFPCLRLGSSSRFERSISKPAMTFLRVSAGSMTSSTMPRSAAM